MEEFNVLDIKQIEKLLGEKLSNSKINEINNLFFNNKKSKKDLTGQFFNRLLVIGRGPDYISPKGKINSQWYCICSCKEHNIILVRISNLTTNNTKSCGCLNQEKTITRIKKIGKSMASNLKNQRFGKLIALYPTDERKNGSVVWMCKCDCGNFYKAASTQLSRGDINSCGCLKESKGVLKIEEILKEKHLKYIKEKTFESCRFKDTNALARFDFYVENKFLIEYDGEQHFIEKDNKYFKDSLQKIQQHDNFKNEWCKMNHIPLIRFSYLELDKISYSEIIKRLKND